MNLQEIRSHPAFPFVLPYLIFGLSGLLHNIHPLAIYFTYALKTILVASILIIFWRSYSLSWPRPAQLLGSIAVGLLVLAAWILPYELLTKPENLTTAYNPAAHFENTLLITLLITIRILGATLTVPLMEEIFIRGFLQRYLIDQDFKTVPHGTYTHFSFWTTTAIFALAHGTEWHVGILAGTIFGAWYIYTRSLTAVIIAHAITNLALGLYVVISGKTYFW
jgi:CAAX prenyl protease-like protein